MAAHPLTRPSSWTLTVGAPGMPLIRWAGTLLWAAGALTGAAWLFALGQDAVNGQVHAAWFLLAAPTMLTWLILAWRVWRRWFSRAYPLTLQWRGPVSRDPAQGHPPGGFCIEEWRAPVRVRMVLSFQGWLMLSLQGLDEGVLPVHAWLDAREAESSPFAEAAEAAEVTVRNRSLHQLRTLLHLPPSMTTQERDAGTVSQAPGGVAREPVASWATTYHPGAMLHRLASLFRAGRRPGIASSRLDTVFPATTVMAERAAQRGAVREGGRG